MCFSGVAKWNIDGSVDLCDDLIWKGKVSFRVGGIMAWVVASRAFERALRWILGVAANHWKTAIITRFAADRLAHVKRKEHLAWLAKLICIPETAAVRGVYHWRAARRGRLRARAREVCILLAAR